MVFFFSLYKYLKVELLDEKVVIVFLRGISVLFSIVTVPVYIPVSGSGEQPSLHILKKICFFFFFFWLFDNSHSDKYEVIPHCGLTWIPVISNFSCACWPFVCLWKMSIPEPWPNFWSGCLVIHVELCEFCVYFDIKSLSDIYLKRSSLIYNSKWLFIL